MNIVLKAYRFGDLKHKGQVRKVSGADYISHPIAVSYVVAAHKKSKHLEELLAAAILHDTLEDTDTSFEELAREFTPLVASLVLELSSDKEEISRMGKLSYLKKKLIGLSSYGLVLKLADRLHNVSDSPTDKMKADTLELMKFLKKNRKLSNTQTVLVEKIVEMLRK
jgi:(p)ppGpp synthase/HD superfamily hydrolase